MKAEAASGGAPERAPLLHVEPTSGTVNTQSAASSGNTPGGVISHGDRRGSRLAAIGALACCGAVAAFATTSGVSSTAVVHLGAGKAKHSRGKVTSALGAKRAALLGRENNRVLMSPAHHLAYCNVPKAASSTVTTYMTGLNAGINTLKGVEEYIQANGGDSHFAMTQYSTFEDAELAESLSSDGANFKVFTVVRHPGTRLYSTWFDKIHSHRGSDQPDLLWYGCNNNEDCSFEQFVDGITKQISDPEAKKSINEHVEPQSDMCDPSTRDFDGVFKLEDGFDSVATKLREWTGTPFDFKSEDGETGYSHHNQQSKEVYSEFPVSDAEGYESLMPYAIQMKIYEAYRNDFELFGYPKPTQRDSQLDTCPKIKWSKELLESEWSGEDAKHLKELEQQGLLDSNILLPPREELAAPRNLNPPEAGEGLQEQESNQGKENGNGGTNQPNQQSNQSGQNNNAPKKPVPTAFGGNEILGDDYEENETGQPDRQSVDTSAASDPDTNEVVAKKALVAEDSMQRTSDEQKEWEAEVDEARRLHDDEGLTATDAIEKAHSEAVWLKEQKRKLEHASRMLELDQKWGTAKQHEAQRLVEVEGMSWEEAEKKATGEARWLRQREEEKISLAEQMSAAESEKRHQLAIEASSAEASAGLSEANVNKDSPIPVELQNAVGMNSVDPDAGDYSDVDSKIPGLNPPLSEEEKSAHLSAAEEKARVEAQWRAPDADVRDIQAEYVQWMQKNGKKLISGEQAIKARKAASEAKQSMENAQSKSAKHAVIPEALPDPQVKPPTLQNIAAEKQKAQDAFVKWKSENNVAGGAGVEDYGSAQSKQLEQSGQSDYETQEQQQVTPEQNAQISFGNTVGGTTTVGSGTGLVDPEEVAEHEARAAAAKDLEIASEEDADKLARFEAWKQENEKQDYEEDVVKPVPISEDGRIMTPEQAKEEAEQALIDEQESDEYKQWAQAQGWIAENSKGGGDGVQQASSLGSEASVVGTLGTMDSFNIFDAPEGHRLDFIRELGPFLDMRKRVQADHDLLAEELDAIRVATPDVFRLIQENMDEFKRFMMEGIDVSSVQQESAKPLPTADEVFGYLGSQQ